MPRLTPEQLARLEQIARKQSSEASMTTRARLNHQFYTTLFESLDRPRLRGMMDRLEREVERYLLPGTRPHWGIRRSSKPVESAMPNGPPNWCRSTSSRSASAP